MLSFRKVLDMAAKKFFIRQTSIERLLHQVSVLEQKIDILSQRSIVDEVVAAVDSRTAVYSPHVPVEPVALKATAFIEEDAPIYIPKARIGQASLKKVKTTIGSHDTDNVEKLKRKRTKKDVKNVQEAE